MLAAFSIDVSVDCVIAHFLCFFESYLGFLALLCSSALAWDVFKQFFSESRVVVVACGAVVLTSAPYRGFLSSRCIVVHH